MKFTVKLVIFIFFIFISTPTIVSLIEKNTEISFFYSSAELEDMHKDVKLEFKFDAFSFAFYNLPKMSSIVLSENLSKHDNISTSIFFPPPDLV
jgi:hypothetical protein